MKPVICFIDDSTFEHDLVRDQIAPFAPAFTFVQAYTFEEARTRLGEITPSLFLLDLWGQDEAVKHPVMPVREEMEERVACFPSLEQVYEGLEDFQGDVHNEYLKRLFAIVSLWRSLFEEAAASIGQNRKYGLANLQKARAVYGRVPAVFYTRKSMISDAVAMFEAGADGLLIKPTGKNDAETRELTVKFAPTLLARLQQILKT